MIFVLTFGDVLLTPANNLEPIRLSQPAGVSCRFAVVSLVGE